MRVGIADHLGWAVAVTASADHVVVDRRRMELVEAGLPAAPIHYEGKRLDVGAAAALVAKVRASVVRTASAALDELAVALPSRSCRSRSGLAAGLPAGIAVQLRPPYESRHAIMYRRVLSELASPGLGRPPYVAATSSVRRPARWRAGRGGPRGPR